MKTKHCEGPGYEGCSNYRKQSLQDLKNETMMSGRGTVKEG